MTQEQKDLLLKDLCARLPYGVRAYYNDYDSDYEIESIKIVSYGDYKTGSIHLDIIDSTKIVGIDEIKPYLFPLSSMTEEQKEELKSLMVEDSFGILYHTLQSYDYLYKNHIDIRGFIDIDLAKDATGLNIY